MNFIAKKYLKNQKGQTLFELVMAIAIGIVIITGIVILTTLSLNNSSFAKNDSNSLRYTQEGLEWVRTERDKSWATVVAKSGPVGQTYCISDLSWGSQGQCSTMFYKSKDIGYSF
jgi:Tfp pilus assembly protein PilV